MNVGKPGRHAEPRIVGSHKTPDLARDVAVTDSHVFVAVTAGEDMGEVLLILQKTPCASRSPRQVMTVEVATIGWQAASTIETRFVDGGVAMRLRAACCSCRSCCSSSRRNRRRSG